MAPDGHTVEVGIYTNDCPQISSGGVVVVLAVDGRRSDASSGGGQALKRALGRRYLTAFIFSFVFITPSILF